MKITTKQVPIFIKKIPNNIKIILLHGNDQGIIQELSKKISENYLENNHNEYSITEINNSSLNDDNLIIQQSIYNESLFGCNKKVIIISNCNSFTTSKIKDIIDDINQDTLIILLADILSTNNTLRVLIEKNTNTVSIACYHDNDVSLKTYIQNFLTKHSYTIDSEAIKWLINNLGNDRLITYQELNKLILYKGKNKHINLEEVIKVISHNSDLEINDLILNIFSGNYFKLYNSISQYLLNYPAVMLLRGMMNFLKRLIFVKSLELQKLPINTILSKLNPPVLFLHLEKFKFVISIWELNQINNFLKQCIILELNIKKYPNLTSVLLNKFALDIFLIKNKNR